MQIVACQKLLPCDVGRTKRWMQASHAVGAPLLSSAIERPESRPSSSRPSKRSWSRDAGATATAALASQQQRGRGCPRRAEAVEQQRGSFAARPLDHRRSSIFSGHNLQSSPLSNRTLAVLDMRLAATGELRHKGVHDCMR